MQAWFRCEVEPDGQPDRCIITLKTTYPPCSQYLVSRDQVLADREIDDGATRGAVCCHLRLVEDERVVAVVPGRALISGRDQPSLWLSRAGMLYWPPEKRVTSR